MRRVRKVERGALCAWSVPKAKKSDDEGENVTRNDVRTIYVKAELPKLANHGDLEGFVSSLDDAKRCVLLDWLSAWKKNGVAGEIAKHEHWEEVSGADLGLRRVFVGRINSKVDGLLNSVERRLSKVPAIATQLSESGESFRLDCATDLNEQPVLGRWDDDDVKLFDGNHRAVRAAILGTSLRIVVPKR